MSESLSLQARLHQGRSFSERKGLPLLLFHRRYRLAHSKNIQAQTAFPVGQIHLPLPILFSEDGIPLEALPFPQFRHQSDHLDQPGSFRSKSSIEALQRLRLLFYSIVYSFYPSSCTHIIRLNNENSLSDRYLAGCALFSGINDKGLDLIPFKSVSSM